VTTATTSLAAWLLAQIEADEAWARAAAAEGFVFTAPSGGKVAIVPVGHVLATCAAHRRIVELHVADIDPNWDPACSEDDYGLRTPDECQELRALASIYADRAGWREEWTL
jgi:hypothetical protein